MTKRKVLSKASEPAVRSLALIGLGGIGSWLLQATAPMLAYDHNSRWNLLLIDGDSYETKNHVRQAFNIAEVGEKKADVQAKWIRSSFNNITAISISSYLTPHNIGSIIHNNDIVLLAVDNHATRKLVNDHIATLDDAILISAGNDEIDGNVQVYRRSQGEDITPSLSSYHPEIAEPSDKLPSDMSCEEKLAQGSQQTLAANFMAASLALNELTKVLGKGIKLYKATTEIYFNCLSNAASPRSRPLLEPIYASN